MWSESKINNTICIWKLVPWRLQMNDAPPLEIVSKPKNINSHFFCLIFDWTLQSLIWIFLPSQVEKFWYILYKIHYTYTHIKKCIVYSEVGNNFAGEKTFENLSPEDYCSTLKVIENTTLLFFWKYIQYTTVPVSAFWMRKTSILFGIIYE